MLIPSQLFSKNPVPVPVSVPVPARAPARK